MNEWLKKVFGKIKDAWSKWKPIQKVILIGIVVVIIVVIVVTAKMSAKPSSVKLFNTPITDSNTRDRILDRLNEEAVDVNYDEKSGYIYISDEKSKRKMIQILNDENLVPSNVNIWDDYFSRGWSTTDADQNVKYKVKRQEELKRFIESYADVQWADVKLEIPEKELFTEEQNPVSASIIISPKNGSTLLQDRKRLEGIQRAVIAGVEGLKEEFLVITDVNGNQVNDFAGMADFDKLTLTERTEKFKLKLATEIRAKILRLFQNTYGPDRCRDIAVTIEMDTSVEESNIHKINPTEVKPDNPDTPYDDSETVMTVPRSQQTVTKEWQGTGYNPEGPAGTEGQTPPVHSDMSNVIGKSTETGVTVNNEFGTEDTHKEKAPQIDKISVSVNLDGIWEKAYEYKNGKRKPKITEDGALERKYTGITINELKEDERSIQGAIGYDRLRGDLVVVTNIPYDRKEQFAQEDNEYFAKLQRTRTIILVLIVIAVVLVGFILFRVISKEIERKRREREARLLAEQQAARERALWDAKEEGMEVTMSVEETRRMELQENAITMAKEHPEDVAMLIRTWLMEE